MPWITTIIVLFAAVMVVRRAFLGYATPSENYENISNAEVAMLEAVSEVMFPKGGDIDASWAEADVIRYVDQYFGQHSTKNRVLMHLLLYLIEHATILFVPSWKRLSDLDAQRRYKYIDEWEHSNLYLKRMVFTSLRAILCMAYCAHPLVEKQMGYFRNKECLENRVVQ